MSNYVSNKVICKKSFFEKYFLDPYALGKDNYAYCNEHKYISFNKLYEVKDVNEYREKYGQYVDYSSFYEVKDIENGYVKITFRTRCLYPICAIKKAIEIDHSIIWYALEENVIYISKFIWEKDKVIEKTLNIENDDFVEWYDKHIYNGNTYDNIDDSDDAIWYYDYENRNDWITWPSDDLIKRYKDDYPSSDYYNWYNKIKNN